MSDTGLTGMAAAEAEIADLRKELAHLRAQLATAREEATNCWDIINDLELAIISLGIPELVEGWGEPRHRPEIGVSLRTTAGTVYQVYDAFRRANTLMNEGSRALAMLDKTDTGGDHERP